MSTRALALVLMEDARSVFGRYRAIRERERLHVDWPDPLAGSAGADDHAEAVGELLGAIPVDRHAERVEYR